jgi:hypothetical protein
MSSPRLRPLEARTGCEGLQDAGLSALRQLLRFADGYELEPNYAPMISEDVGIEKILSADAVSPDADGVVFATGVYDTRYWVSEHTGEIVRLDPGDSAAGASPRTKLAPSLGSLLTGLRTLETDSAFDGCPTAIDVVQRLALPRRHDDDRIPRFTGGHAPPVNREDPWALAYVECLPAWLQEILAVSNGGYVAGVMVNTEPDPERFDALYCVAPETNQEVPDGSGMRALLIREGMDPRYFPIGRTQLGNIVLVDAGANLMLKYPDALVPLPEQGTFVAALRRATDGDTGASSREAP